MADWMTLLGNIEPGAELTFKRIPETNNLAIRYECNGWRGVRIVEDAPLFGESPIFEAINDLFEKVGGRV